MVAEEQVLLEFRAIKIQPLKNSALRHREFLLQELVDFTKSVVPNVKDPLSNEAKPLKNYFQSGLLIADCFKEFLLEEYITNMHRRPSTRL